MKIVLTGSHGLIGKIILEKIIVENEVRCIDRVLGIDILYDDLGKYFEGADSLIHLAANPNPFIDKKEAEKNIEIVEKVIQESQRYVIKRIINASSINVYPYIELYEQKKIITKDTQLSPNFRFGDGSYSKAKIKAEKMFEDYCKQNNVSLINLRLGCVTAYNLPYVQANGHVEPIDNDIHLKHEGLIEVIEKSLRLTGIQSYVCVSKRNCFVEDNILFPKD